jgi:hypothetical protein
MAEYKDYTNIAGTPFQPYVTKQIEKRKELIKTENRSSSDLQWLTNKNVWIRISSGADVEDSNTNFDDLGEVKGQKLARKYILQGGLFKDTSRINDNGITQDIRELRAGIGPDGAYGIGGNDFGYRPMPGLTNLSIKTGGKLGTLREATFEFTCYNKKQLDIMSALYMRLGFSVLVEWGHTFFINNNGIVETNIKPLPFFKSSNQAGINTKEELLEEIQKNRVLHSGNYDALWGTIKNFTYSLEDNGTFKCQVQLVGAGDILESLKINQSSNTKDDTSSDESKTIYATIADKNKSKLNEALYNYYIAVAEEINTKGYDFNDGTKFLTLVEKYLKPNLGISFNINENTFSWSKNDELQRKGYQFSLISKLNENNGNVQSTEIPDIKNAQNFFSRLIVGYEINNEDIGNSIEKPGLEQAYITLGHLLLLIKATGFIFDKKDDQNEPYIYIDVNPETNRCYTFPGHCSLDPTICLIGSEKLPYQITDSKLFKFLQEKYPFHDPFNPELGGRFMHTLVNIEFITNILKKYSTQSEKGDVYFVDFIKDILSGISKACGGFNEFRVVPDDDTRCIRIFDDIGMPNFEYETNNYLKIPVLGKESIVYNFSYTSKISPQMASQIIIAAQAQDKSVINNKDSLSFSHLNEGLINRLSPTRVEATTDSNLENPETSNLSKYIELRKHLEGIYAGTGIALITQEDLNNIRTEIGIIPNDRITENILNDLDETKKLLRTLLEKIYGDLQTSANNITPVTKDGKNELQRLLEAYDIVFTEINNLNEIPKSIILEVSEDKKTFTSTLSLQYNYIHDKLESKYESINTFKDTEIELAWTKLAIKQTGVARSWY